MEAAMVRKDSRVGKDAGGRESETPIVTLRDEELIPVAGGFAMLTNSFSNAIKTIGEGLSTMARKG
jgi:hypothetical protein